MSPICSLLLLSLSVANIALALPNELGRRNSTVPDSTSKNNTISQNESYEYIVVGSGAGGGPLAARLALAGKKVLLIEAGDDQGQNLNQQIPTFHAYATEDKTMAWDFYVKHYTDPSRAQRDSKMTWTTPSGSLYVGAFPPAGSKQKGILYPRSGTLGGCTAHNALVNVYPHEKDWDNIVALTGDRSWSAASMRRLYEKLEKVDYIRVGNPGHGFNGWLGVGRADVTLALNDTKLLALGLNSASTMGHGGLGGSAVNLGRILAGDANSGSPGRDQTEGVYNIPLAEYGGKRNGAREFVMQTYNEKTLAGGKKWKLDIWMETLVTKVIFAEGGTGTRPKATGVEFLKGKSLYRADPRSGSATGGTPAQVFATKEVILSGGAFNTPQLLKLSGIGPKDELTKFDIPVKVDLPGVGTNLQDHFEIGVTHQAKDSFAVIEHCTYGRTLPDTCLENWKKEKGPYASSNGFIFAMIKKSSVANMDTVFGGDPDLLMFGGIANFKGYYPGYSNDVYGYRNWTWVVLKAHTGNFGAKAGTVKLASKDPRDVPEITFNYFDTGSTANGAADRDLQAMVEGVALSRNISSSTSVPLTIGKTFTEMLPGEAIQTDAQLKEHIKAEAWSHHASCTCPIGADGDPMAVLDSKFRVRGVDGLRVVDASVFPRIPGYFIAVPTYMVGEKGAETILSGN
ncbi:alcohol oxidase [Tothia fuscella]|uniref:Alcohol oxidase n=1 Tax=Tothia fuscella TaxID=1048955 RepID=A0A9P4NGG3_9PEZI|nr:alcohol oxidase [Tothia fuscella]